MKPLIPYFEPVAITLFTFPEGMPMVGGVPLTIHGFGILVAVGFIVGNAVARRTAERYGLDGEAINRLIGWLVLGTFVGGHIGHGLMYEPDVYLADPRKFLQVWQGLSSFGGFIACIGLTVWFFRREKLKLWPYADMLIYGFTLGWFFGRMGCFAAHDHPGNPTEFWLGVYGMCADRPVTIACHDLGLYEAIFSLILFGLFTLLLKRPRFPGFYTGLFAVVYGVVRFGMDFLRDPDVDTRYFGITPAQYGSFTLVLVGLVLLFVLKDGKPLAPAEGSPEPAEG